MARRVEAGPGEGVGHLKSRNVLCMNLMHSYFSGVWSPAAFDKSGSDSGSGKIGKNRAQLGLRLEL